MNISENIKKVKFKIEKSAEKSGRDPSEIKLLAVTKTHSSEIVDIALKYGIQFIAENKIQEAEKKLPLLKETYREFHFIGHLQSNKIKKLMKLKPALIHSIDKFSTLKKLNEYLLLNNIKQNVLIQVNTSKEESKFGIEPIDTLSFIKESSKLSNIRIKGLMTIGMFTNDTEAIRNCFKILHRLFMEIQSVPISNVEMKLLSMGMSNDFEIAIEEGANIVRIGSAIFGEREYYSY